MTTIINELLCYVLNKIDSVPQDTLVRLISENFSEEEVDAAKCLLSSHVPESVRTGNRRGQNKKQMNMQDIYKMALESSRDELPRFVALNLEKLPPISINCIDVSALLRKQQMMEMEVSQLKSTIDDVLKISVATSQRVETALSVNSGANLVGPPAAVACGRPGTTAGPVRPAASVETAQYAQGRGDPGHQHRHESGGEASGPAAVPAPQAAGPTAVPALWLAGPAAGPAAVHATRLAGPAAGPAPQAAGPAAVPAPRLAGPAPQAAGPAAVPAPQVTGPAPQVAGPVVGPAPQAAGPAPQAAACTSDSGTCDGACASGGGARGGACTTSGGACATGGGPCTSDSGTCGEACSTCGGACISGGGARAGASTGGGTCAFDIVRRHRCGTCDSARGRLDCGQQGKAR